MADFESLRAPRRAGACPICGETVAGSVFVMVRESPRLGGGKVGRHVVSRSRSFCQEHTTEMYRQLLAALEEAGS